MLIVIAVVVILACAVHALLAHRVEHYEPPPSWTAAAEDPEARYRQ